MTPHSVWRTIYVRANGIIKNYNKNFEENGKQAYKTKMRWNTEQKNQKRMRAKWWEKLNSGKGTVGMSDQATQVCGHKF